MAQTEPMVSVSYHRRYEWARYIDLRIRNVGAGPALDIVLEVEPDLHYLSDRRLSQLNLFKNGLKYLGPGDERSFFITTHYGELREHTIEPFEIRITYRGTIGREKTGNYVIDLSEMTGLSQFGRHPLVEIAESTKTLTKEFTNFRQEFRRR